MTGVFGVMRSILRNDSTCVSHLQTTLRCTVIAHTNHLFRILELGKYIEDALLFLWNNSDAPISSQLSSLDKDSRALWYVYLEGDTVRRDGVFSYYSFVLSFLVGRQL